MGYSGQVSIEVNSFERNNLKARFHPDDLLFIVYKLWKERLLFVIAGNEMMRPRRPKPVGPVVIDMEKTRLPAWNMHYTLTQ